MTFSKPIHRDPIWYPFTQMQEFLHESPLSIASAQGCWLVDEAGNRYLDGVSSLWANVHGHQHPKIDAAVREQLGRVAHSTMLGLTHPGGVELAQRLTALAPPGLDRVFYSDSGATAVEIALKMAYQYWQLQGEHSKQRFLKLSEAYHGDTVGAVSLGGMDIFHERFGPLLFETKKVPTPDMYRHPFGDLSPEEVRDRYFDESAATIQKYADTACAFIVIPRSRSSGALSILSKLRYSDKPCLLNNNVIAAVKVVLPWST